MTPQDQLVDLTNRITKLEQSYSLLQLANMIPLDVEYAFADRLGKSKYMVNRFTLVGSVTLSGGNATVGDGRITVNSVPVITPSSGVVQTGLRATASAGSVAIASTDNLDSRTIYYIIFL